MARIKLTQAAVEKISTPATGRTEYFDTVLPAFGLRVSAGGHKAWVVFYRVQGRQRRYTIGSLAAFPKVDQARERARQILREVEGGTDPAEAKPTSPARPPDTVATLARQFIDRYAKAKNRSWAETEKLLQRHVVARWGGREAGSITRRDMLELMDELVDRGHPIAANRTLAAVRKMFNWAVEREIVPASPATSVKAPGREVERERVLADEELTALWHAADKVGGVMGRFVQALLLTGQRRDEVASMRWADLDLDKRVWTLPREATKGDRTHECPLAPLALELLSTLPRIGDYVFTTRGDRPISGFSKLKERLEHLSGVHDWRLHDLRRTAGTGMARCGITVSAISRVLNHKEGGVTKIYNRYSYLDEKRHALETWARKVESLVRPGPTNVVELRLLSEAAF